MPGYDIAKETGTWTMGKASDNWSQCLQKMGVPADMVEQVTKEKYVIEASVSGDSYTYKMTEFGVTTQNTFKLGVECDETDSSGTHKVTHTVEGDAIVSTYPDYDGKGLKFQTRRHFLDDNTIHSHFKIGDLEGWMESVRV